MDNTTYEFFIRRCWDCERFKHGANTDTWEDLLIKQYNFQNSNVTNAKTYEKQYLTKLNQIKGYLDKAYNKLHSKAIKKKITQNIIDEIITHQSIVKNSSIPLEIFETLKSTFIIINNNNL